MTGKNRSERNSQKQLDESFAKDAPTLEQFRMDSFSQLIIDLEHNTARQIEHLKNHFAAYNEIDQIYLYTDTQSVPLWKSVIETDSYSTYKECKETIERLMASNYWKELVSQSEINNIVDLGVGAGDKDYEILKSYAQHCPDGEVAKMVLIDTSLSMLDVTLSELRDLANKIVLERRREIKIQGIRANFLDIKKLDAYLNEGAGKNIYFLLGGTFSNLDEAKFMRDFSRVTQPGDIFVISAEMYDEARADDDMQRIKDDYNADPIHKFAQVPIKNHLAQEIPMSGEVEIDIVSGSVYSDVPRAKTLQFFTRQGINGPKIKIIKTSRYIEHCLKDFISGFLFELRNVTECPSNSSYKYFSFERVG